MTYGNGKDISWQNNTAKENMSLRANGGYVPVGRGQGVTAGVAGPWSPKNKTQEVYASGVF